MCKKQVLFLTANPKNLESLRFDEEKRAIEESFRITVEPWINKNDLIRILQNAINEPPYIIHFSGHGEEEGIYLEDEAQREYLLESDSLITLFKALKDKVECVILNSCKSGYQAKILAKYINFVIGFSKEILDADSIKFSSHFYQFIAAGLGLKKAASSSFEMLSSKDNGIFYYKGIPGGPNVSEYPIERLQEFIQIKYIAPEFHFSDGFIDDTIFDKYSHLFSLIIELKQSQREEQMENDPGKIIEDISNNILENESLFPLKVNGFSGSGKSTFLTLLYLHMCKRCEEYLNTKIPIYIDLHYYSKRFTESNNDNPEQLHVELIEDWEYLCDIIGKLSGSKNEFIFIINGLEEYDHTNLKFDQYVKKLFDDCDLESRRNKRVIGISTQKKDHSFWNQERISYNFLGEPLRTIDLKSISVFNEKLNGFIETFCEAIRVSNKKIPDSCFEHLKTQIKEFNLHQVDLFMLRLLQYKQVKWGNRKFKDLSEFYLFYCKNNLAYNLCGEDQNRAIDEAAKLAFRCVVKNERINFSEKKKCWLLIHSHDTFQNFLLAQYIVTTLQKIDKSESPAELIENLNYIYPTEINSFLKELVNQTNYTQRTTFNVIAKINNELIYKKKAQLCLYYILGRFTDDIIKDKAKQLLIEQKQAIPKKIAGINNKSKELDLLLFRSIYISLIYLGERSSLKEYLKKLMEDPLWENVNRGFHLEYYGDIPFDITENLLNRDDLKKDFPMTYSRLYSSLDKAINNRKFHLLFDIELYTLCSLAQHRHIIGELDEEKRNGIISLTERALNVLRENIDYNDDFHQYILMINNSLKVPELSVNYFIKKFFATKSLKREGWVKRRIDYPESVAAHMYGAYLLGLIHLPNDLQNKEGYGDYDKEKILKMLLIHDLVEVFIGDLLPEQKNENSSREEEKWFKIISMLDTYSVMGTTRYIYDYWHEFQTGFTINAKIAKDLDKLDNLLQLYIYKDLLEPNSFENFRKALLPLIKTDEGRIIKDIIEGNSVDIYISKNKNQLELIL